MTRISFRAEEPNNLLTVDWQRAQSLGVFDDVRTPADYRSRVARGLKAAYSFLSTSKDPIPTIPMIQKIHYFSFAEVHPWAGDFRPLGHEVAAGSLMCVDSKEVKKELTHLTKEMKAEPFFGSGEYVAEAIAYYHSAFEAIHPFLDGNGRIGRLIMGHQMRLGLGQTKETTFSRDEYIRALIHSQTTGELGPFKKLLLRCMREHRVDKSKGLCFER